MFVLFVVVPFVVVELSRVVVCSLPMLLVLVVVALSELVADELSLTTALLIVAFVKYLPFSKSAILPCGVSLYFCLFSLLDEELAEFFALLSDSSLLLVPSVELSTILSTFVDESEFVPLEFALVSVLEVSSPLCLFT